MAAGPFWRAWSIWAVSVGATVAALSYAAVHPVPGNAGSAANWVFGVMFIGAFATVGALLAWKRPGNPIGWLMSATGLAYAAGAFTEFLQRFPRTLALAHWLGWTWLAGLGLCVLVVLLFPTGQLPSRRWRPVAWAAWAGLAGWVLGNAFAPSILTASATEPNPVGVSGLPGDVFTIMATGGGTVLIPAAGLAAVLSLAFRYRRAQAAERAQLKWLVYAGALIVAAVLAEIPAERIVGPGDAADNLQNAITSGAVALVALAIGIAVLKYRLYDIDRVISRTLAYAIVTGLLAGIYAGLALLATGLLRLHSLVAVAAATLAAAALFSPIRRRVQRVVDRRFNRARYDAQTMVAAFAARLKDAVDLDTIRDDLASAVQAAMEPAHLSMWTSQND